VFETVVTPVVSQRAFYCVFRKFIAKYVALCVTNFVPVLNMSQIAVYGLVQSKKSSVQRHSDFKTSHLTLKYDDDLARTDKTFRFLILT
jgi:hypothetical protein